MKSPFPGFDPYLEQHWGDVHNSLAIYARNALQGHLPGDLRARTEERVYVEYGDNETREIVPDVSVIERPNSGTTPSGGAGAAVLAPDTVATPIMEPLEVVIHEPNTESFVQIREKGGGRLITVIEFISPSNKIPGTGRDLYQRKQRELDEADVHLVEIDFVRAASAHRVFDHPAPIRDHCRHLLMAHTRKGYQHRLYAFSLRERLGALPIPLRYDEPEITLDLQSLVYQCYRDGAYDDIDYGREPVPPLDPDNAAWADALLRETGKR